MMAFETKVHHRKVKRENKSKGKTDYDSIFTVTEVSGDLTDSKAVKEVLKSAAFPEALIAGWESFAWSVLAKSGVHKEGIKEYDNEGNLVKYQHYSKVVEEKFEKGGKEARAVDILLLIDYLKNNMETGNSYACALHGMLLGQQVERLVFVLNYELPALVGMKHISYGGMKPKYTEQDHEKWILEANVLLKISSFWRGKKPNYFKLSNRISKDLDNSSAQRSIDEYLKKYLKY